MINSVRLDIQYFMLAQGNLLREFPVKGTAKSFSMKVD